MEVHGPNQLDEGMEMSTEATPLPPEVVESENRRFKNEAERLRFEHFRRVISGAETIPPLEVAPEVRKAVDTVLQGIDVSPEARQRVTNDFNLQYHHGGKRIACLRRSGGVMVLAVEPEDVSLLLKHLEAEEWADLRIEYPDPW